MKTRLCDQIGCRYPILQAGMGGVARADLVTAVTLAGGYGFLGMVRETAAFIRDQIHAVKARTDGPFGVNLIPAATDPALFEEELAVCIDEDVHSVCFFWEVNDSAIRQAKQAGRFVFHQVGSVADAITAERSGADAIIAQGMEAGGHVMGTTSTLTLIPQVVRAVDVPVIASGGIATGQGLLAALALCCQAIHCGTAFLATRESYAHDYHKQSVINARSEDTIYTDAFAINWPPRSPVRVIGNSSTLELGDKLLGYRPDDFGRDAIARDDDRPIYRYSTDSPLQSTSGSLEPLALFAGQVCGLVVDIPTAHDRILQIMRSADTALARLTDDFGAVQ